VAVAVGPGQGEEISALLTDVAPNAHIHVVRSGTVDAALELRRVLSQRGYDAVVGIGGGRTLDVTKYAATGIGLPMISVATNLAHDGIASPVSSLLHSAGKGSFGVAPPLAVVVDLDFVRHAPAALIRAGVGDALSNLSAIADWYLAAEVCGEPVDGLAVTLARTAAQSVLHQQDTIDSPGFLITLAEALVMSGLAMSAAGSSRPCSGGDHEILHAVEHLHPGISNHGELAGLGASFTTFLRSGAGSEFQMLDGALSRHCLPRVPADIGLGDEEFAAAVQLAPSTRPERFTILEHLDMNGTDCVDAVARWVAAVAH
jgi:glycerol-1-phosphate dehydrogenase [NAD(P)+]